MADWRIVLKKDAKITGFLSGTDQKTGFDLKSRNSRSVGRGLGVGAIAREWVGRIAPMQLIAGPWRAVLGENRDADYTHVAIARGPCGVRLAHLAEAKRSDVVFAAPEPVNDERCVGF